MNCVLIVRSFKKTTLLTEIAVYYFDLIDHVPHSGVSEGFTQQSVAQLMDHSPIKTNF